MVVRGVRGVGYRRVVAMEHKVHDYGLNRGRGQGIVVMVRGRKEGLHALFCYTPEVQCRPACRTGAATLGCRPKTPAKIRLKP